MGTEKPVHRAQSDGDPARDRKRIADLPQGQIGLLGNQLQHPRAVLAQPGATVATRRARACMALGPPALRPASSAANADIKPCGRRPCAAAQRQETNHRSLKSCEYGAGISPSMHPLIPLLLTPASD